MDYENIIHIQDSFVIGNSILGIISLISCLITILLFIFKPCLRDFMFKLTFYLSISEMLNIIAYLFSLDFLNNPNIYDSNICSFQPLIITYSNVSSLLWILLICYSIYDLLVNKNEFYDKKTRKYLMIGFIAPIIPTLLCFLNENNKTFQGIFEKNNKSEGIVDISCSKTLANGVSLAIIIIYWIIIVIIAIYCYKILKFLGNHLENDRDEDRSKMKKNLCKRIFNYPIIIILSFTFCSVHRIFQYVYLDEYSDKPSLVRLDLILLLINGLYSNIRGFLFFLVFGCQNHVKKELKSIFMNLLNKSDKLDIEI